MKEQALEYKLTPKELATLIEKYYQTQNESEKAQLIKQLIIGNMYLVYDYVDSLLQSEEINIDEYTIEDLQSAGIEALTITIKKILENPDFTTPFRVRAYIGIYCYVNTCLNQYKQGYINTCPYNDEDYEAYKIVDFTASDAILNVAISELEGRISEKYKETLRLYYQEGLTHEKIAEKLGITASGVGKRIRIATNELLKILGIDSNKNKKVNLSN